MSGEPVLYAAEQGIATLTLNRPERLNALDLDLAEAFVRAFSSAAADPAVRVVVVTGAGRAFSAGGDLGYLHELAERGDEVAFRALIEAGADMVRRVAACAKPVIAAINGAAAGGGMNLALASDLRVASAGATFSEAFVKVGMHPDFGGIWILPRLVGLTRALDLVLTGRTVKADEALAIGLVTRVVAPEALASETRALALALAAGPPLALADAKRNLWRSLDGALDAMLAAEVESQMRCFRSRDGREGMAAFREKRKPSFRGE